MAAPLSNSLLRRAKEPARTVDIQQTGSGSGGLTPSRVPTVDVTPSTQEMQVVRSQQIELRPEAVPDSETVNTTVADPHLRPEPLMLGRAFGGFMIRTELGRGGMGVVYRADDPALGRVVAIKVLINADPDSRRRFLREARLAAGLNHPHVVTVHQIAEDGGLPFIVTEYLPFGSLESLIKKLGPMPPAAALRATVAAGRALAFAHHRKIIHRDVKPANLLVAEDGTVKLGDFGISKSLGEAGRTVVTQPLTGDGSLVGTPQFISPEQWCGQPGSPAADQYALGCTLFYLLCGRNPFQGAGLYQILQKHIHQPLPDVRTWMPAGQARGLPDDLHGLLSRAAAKRPEERFASVTELADHVERLAFQIDSTGRQTVAAWIRHRVPPERLDNTARSSFVSSEPSKTAAVQTPDSTGPHSRELASLSTRTSAPSVPAVAVAPTARGVSPIAYTVAATALGISLFSAAMLALIELDRGHVLSVDGWVKAEKSPANSTRADGLPPLKHTPVESMTAASMMGTPMTGISKIGNSRVGTELEPPMMPSKTDPLPPTKTADMTVTLPGLRTAISEELLRTANWLMTQARPPSEKLRAVASAWRSTWSTAASRGERSLAAAQLADALAHAIASGNPSRLVAMLDRHPPDTLAARCELLRAYERVTLLPPKPGLPPEPDIAGAELIVGWRLRVASSAGSDNRVISAELPLMGPLELTGKPLQRRWTADRLAAALPDPISRERPALQAAVDDLFSLDSARCLARLADPNTPAGSSAKNWLDWLAAYRNARQRSGSDFPLRFRLLSMAVFPPSEDASPDGAPAQALVVVELHFGDRLGGRLHMRFVKLGADWKLSEQHAAPAK